MHQDDAISTLLSKLSLRGELSMNKDIEEKNKERELKTRIICFITSNPYYPILNRISTIIPLLTPNFHSAT
jgi:hypothetical protein